MAIVMKPFLFKIFFLCEDMGALDRALKLKAALVNNCRDQGLIQASFYEFARLCHPQLRETATNEAATADMLIVSSSGKDDLPLFVQNWLSGIVPQKEKIACVVFIRSDLAEATGRQFLEGWSNQKGAVFFSNGAVFTQHDDYRTELNHVNETFAPAWLPRPSSVNEHC
jgi:hypothetical protein